MLVRNDKGELRRLMRRAIEAWRVVYPEQWEPWQRFMAKERDKQANFHSVDGLSESAGIMLKGHCPGDLAGIIQRNISKDWTCIPDCINAFYDEFEIGCINRSHTNR